MKPTLSCFQYPFLLYFCSSSEHVVLSSGWMEALAFCTSDYLRCDPCRTKASLGWLRGTHLGHNTVNVSIFLRQPQIISTSTMNIKVTWITNKIQKTHLQMVFSPLCTSFVSRCSIFLYLSLNIIFHSSVTQMRNRKLEYLKHQWKLMPMPVCHHQKVHPRYFMTKSW